MNNDLVVIDFSVTVLNDGIGVLAVAVLNDVLCCIANPLLPNPKLLFEEPLR